MDNFIFYPIYAESSEGTLRSRPGVLAQKEIKRPPLNNAPVKRAVPFKRLPVMRPQPQRTAQLKRAPTVQRSAAALRSATLQRPAMLQRPATAVRMQRSAPVKRIVPARDSVAVKQSPDPVEKETSTKEDDQNAEAEKPEKVDANIRSEGQHELSPRLSRALDAELQRIMIKVWQEFPDDPTTAEEKLVADKFRNEAGDSLRNVLGLNVTKRLLKFNNSLYVKIYFMTRPERGTLTEFIKKYNIRTFKRIDNRANMFAGQMATFDDFDRICSAKEVYCGRVKVTVKPCYSFTSCPPNLKTVFAGNTENDETLKVENDVEEKTVKSTDQTESKQETSETKADGKQEAGLKNVGETLQMKNSDKSEQLKKEKTGLETQNIIPQLPKREKPEPTCESPPTKKQKSEEIKEDMIASGPVIITKATENATRLLRKVKHEPISESPSTKKEKSEAIKKEIMDSESVNITKAKEAVTPLVRKVKPEPISESPSTKKGIIEVIKKEKTAPNPVTVTKPNENIPAQLPRKEKPETISKSPTKKEKGQYSNALEDFKEHIGKKPDQKGNIKTEKPTQKRKTSYDAKIKIVDEYECADEFEGIPEKQFAEEDEMDDQDILALMSEGIVLDECSGSDEE
ncbi:unnamed protein product, partial [Iphiclides podalirius]